VAVGVGCHELAQLESRKLALAVKPGMVQAPAL
jgi:hypothetical protein